MEKVEGILPFHKDQILKIKPSAKRAEDELVWLKNPFGEYSKRSGYLAITEERMDLHPLDQAAAPDWFQNVWNIKQSRRLKSSFGNPYKVLYQ